MKAYIYSADIYCEDCGKKICQTIRREGFAPDNPEDEGSYDSDEYPKGPYEDGGGEADCPQHCGAAADCINAIVLDDGAKVGAWLENPLTEEGLRYTREAIAEGGEVAQLWAEFYRDEL